MKSTADTKDEPKLVTEFFGEYDDSGVFVYQAYNKEIATWALENQRLGGPSFKPGRMTWIKPSFAWMLYRSGYGMKDEGQTHILKIKISHATLQRVLENCECRHGGGGTLGRVQWDPARDLYTAQLNSKNGTIEPRRKPRARAIQIGMKGELSNFYRENILEIHDVTSLAHKVKAMHELLLSGEANEYDAVLFQAMPKERVFTPLCSLGTAERLGFKRGQTANAYLQKHEVYLQTQLERSSHPPIQFIPSPPIQ